MRYTRWILALVLLVPAASFAQGPGGPGGGGMSPEMQQRMRQFTQFRENHKYTYQFVGTMRALAEMEKGTKCPLTPDQAKKVLAAVAPYKAKQKMTQDNAKAALKGIKAALNTKQLTELGRITQEMEKRRSSGRPGGGGPGGPGAGQRPGGGAPGAGQRPGGGAGGPGGTRRPSFDPAKMKDFNPFAKPKDDNRMTQRTYEGMKESLTALDKKSKAKK